MLGLGNLAKGMLVSKKILIHVHMYICDTFKKNQAAQTTSLSLEVLRARFWMGPWEPELVGCSPSHSRGLERDDL